MPSPPQMASFQLVMLSVVLKYKTAKPDFFFPCQCWAEKNDKVQKKTTSGFEYYHGNFDVGESRSLNRSNEHLFHRSFVHLALYFLANYQVPMAVFFNHRRYSSAQQND
jgi:hypothetical protein